VFDALCLDVRHSLRGLWRTLAFSLIVIITLAIALGATLAVGSLYSAFVLRPLPVRSPEQLVAFSAIEPQANVTGYFYDETFNLYRNAQQSFAQMSMYSGAGLYRVEARSGVFDAVSEAVSPSYFDLVGARPSAGRFFNEEDAATGAVVVLSESFRRRIFGEDGGVGEAVKLNAVPATVIGIAAGGFNGLGADGPTDIIVPLTVTRAAGGDLSAPLRSLNIVGRLKRGRSIDAARAELLARWPSIQAATLPATLPDAARNALLAQRIDVESIASGFSGLRARYGRTLAILLGVMVLLLAVACANVAGLTLARSLARQHEVAVRLALGASARRVFWQLLLDSLLLAGAAFAGAVPLAWGILRVVRASLAMGSSTFRP